MPDPVLGIAGAGVLSGAIQSKSASSAAKAQTKSAYAGIAEQRRQFDEIQKLLAPYVQAGTGAIGAQQGLLGLQGAEAQRSAIQALEQSPQMQAMTKQGENALLQNAAATGGLRGGNLQASLAQFRPQLLSQMIQQQYQNLGGLAQLGQASAAGQTSFGQAAGSNIANLMQQQGAAQAGGALAQGKFLGSIPGAIAGGFGAYQGGGGGLSNLPPINPTAGFAGWSGTNTIGGVFN